VEPRDRKAVRPLSMTPHAPCRAGHCSKFRSVIARANAPVVHHAHGSAARWGVAVGRRFSRAAQHNYVRDVGLRNIPRTLP